ncbi:hypothetical protein MACJ_002963 [Theileria orientalis]|uniref:RecA family profile 1 domain-containing protein n=1 Tax=Theileria orientalis TaxID=68886 RepID=A0A976M717_THEOR|nr:hypothetical protein MACJ_002963 [Theileria orientalis]
MNTQGYKLLLYVVTNDGDDWETPNALVIPVNSHDFKVTLGYIRSIFPLPGNYHFRTRYKHGNGYVWLDLTRDDEPLQSVDNILRLNIETKGDNYVKKANLLPETKIAQYVDKVIQLGKRNLLFRVDIKHLYSIWNLCKTEQDYKHALVATNHFYNFGRQLSPEAVDKLFVTTMRCNMLEEAIELIRGSCNWLKKPPSLSLIYILLNELISRDDFDNVYEVYKIVRTSWQIRLTPTLYEYCIGYMLNTNAYPLEESLMVYGDSDKMGVRLTEETHNKLLEKCLEVTEGRSDLCRVTCMYIISRMTKELERLKSPKSYYLLSWFSFRFKDEINELELPGLKHLVGDWKKCLEYSVNSSILCNQKQVMSKKFFEELGSNIESFKTIKQNSMEFLKKRTVEDIWNGYKSQSSEPQYLRFGISEIDEALNGGILLAKITEIYGPSGSGKTQFALSITSEILIGNLINSTDHVVLYLYTNGTFPIQRMVEILEFKYNEYKKLNDRTEQTTVEQLLQNLYMYKVTDNDELHYLLTSKMEEMLKLNVKLIIIDSIAAIFRGNINERFPEPGFNSIIKIAIILKRIAHEYNLAILAINQASGVVGQGNIPFLNPRASVKPSLGDSWERCINSRILVARTRNHRFRNDLRKFQVIFSSNTALTKPIPFITTKRGVEYNTLFR